MIAARDPNKSVADELEEAERLETKWRDLHNVVLAAYWQSRAADLRYDFNRQAW